MGCLGKRHHKPALEPLQAMYDDYRNWFASTGLRGQLGRKQFANRVEAADIAKSSRRSQGYFFMNVNLR